MELGAESMNGYLDRALLEPEGEKGGRAVRASRVAERRIV